MGDRIQFNNPPVVEVVCGVQFNELNKLYAPHLGLYWEQIRKEFPKIDEVAPIDPKIEGFGPTQTMAFGFADRPPLPRTWFISGNELNLIQVQRDRFLYNWKRDHDDDVKYPSYDKVIVEFENQLDVFCNFVMAEDIGKLDFHQYELTYINVIAAKEGSLSEAIDKGVLTDFVRERDRDRFLPEPETSQWRASFRMPEDQGRLHIVAQPARKTGVDLDFIRLEITARGIPKDNNRANLRNWFDLAHKWITHGFVDITSSEIQKDVWRKTS